MRFARIFFSVLACLRINFYPPSRKSTNICNYLKIMDFI
nr:MAG TPA: hypothetical protein [Caudoviricetes sp.]